MNLTDLKNALKTFGLGAAVVALIGGIYSSTQYFDMFGFSDKHQAGRTRNALASVVSGVVAQKLTGYANSNFNFDVVKTWYPDGTAKGEISYKKIESYVPVTFTSATFSATENSAGFYEGEVEKSEFDWNVKQVSENQYEISRFGPKFDSTLTLSAENGQIKGNYARTLGFDWPITGTYDDRGNVSLNISVPFGLDVGLEGKVKVIEQ